jgi:GNAT superfamily N-acetyltransferase
MAVLDGVLAGRLWTDDPERPTWAVVIETADGTVYGGGHLTAEAISRIMGEAWTSSGDLIFGFTGPDDPVRRLLPDDPPYVGVGIDFSDRDRSSATRQLLGAAVPDGLELVELDAERLPRAEWGEDTLLAFGSADAWTERGIGRCLVDRDGAIVAHAMAGPRVRDTMEMGIWVHEDHRRQGLGTLLSAHTALAAEAAAAEVWWNTNATNAGSIAIARRLGFRRERRYDLVAYRTQA